MENKEELEEEADLEEVDLDSMSVNARRELPGAKGTATGGRCWRQVDFETIKHCP